MGNSQLFIYFCFEGATLIGSSPSFFWSIGHFSIEAALWTPVAK